MLRGSGSSELESAVFQNLVLLSRIRASLGRAVIKYLRLKIPNPKLSFLDFGAGSYAKDKDNDKEIDGATYSVCKLWGDPHVKRFDGTFIDLLDAGNYTMVESRYISDSEIKTRYTMSITTDSTFRTTESEKYLYIFF